MKFFTDKLIVMHQGTVVEKGLTTNIFRKPESPYSKLLLEAAFNKEF
jgi:ABC-type microcin C transport system duplicated ATPase subunit YejF